MKTHTNPDGTTIQVPDSARIKSDAVIESCVVIECDAMIKSCAVIGRGARIERGAWVKSGARIGRGVMIERGARIGCGVVIESDAWIGRDAWIKSDAWIESGAWIKSGAWVKSGARIGRGVMIERGARIGCGVVIEKSEQHKALGARLDGYIFTMYVFKGDVWIVAGCHNFTFDEAIAHWSSDSYRDRALGDETLVMIRSGLEVLRLRGVLPDAIDHQEERTT